MIQFKTHKPELSFDFNGQGKVTFFCPKEKLEVLNGLKDGEYEVEIKPYSAKRSLNSNAYAWLLQGEMAKVLNRKIDDIHAEMVLQYGVIEVLSVKKEATESVTRMCDYFEILGESSVNGKVFNHIKCGIGTHLYNQAEMTKFLNGVVQECKDLGIDTRTPEEIALMNARWGK